MRYFRVGLLYFQETFSKELDYKFSQMEPISDKEGKPVQILVEHVPIHEYGMDLPYEYDLVVDRASHYYKLGISMFMMMAHSGTKVVNNPFAFHYFIDRKDVGYHIAHKLGVKVPPTYVLPPCKTPYFRDEDFSHHRFFDWDKIIADVGFPCFLKPANGRGARGVVQCRNKMELLEAYNDSGKEIMVLQSKVDCPYDWQLRCLCVGKRIEVCKYIFRDYDQSEYIEEVDFLDEKTLQKVLDATKIINRSMGYEMNSAEFFLDKDGEPWAIDFNNPIPDGRQEALGGLWYEKYQDLFVNLIVDCAKEKPSLEPFIPDVNSYAEIARMKISPEKRFVKALKLANKYYEA